ncbi:hypothetical protein GGX14DRAFT_694431 [Mycena pura]|uniref:DUF6534 domain-containing protein n=1 Tax=Mycena pura TaxID=153505 RepID=A0AAD6YMF8_9AGAR|nr:hypothetical protein GGX14DRAFT_694431 [Mycena pura]
MTLSAIDTITGALLVGTWANSLLYAVELTQALYYFRHFQHDDWTLRTLVAVALFIDTVSTLGDYACVYLYTITHAGDPVYLIQGDLWPLPLHIFTTAIVAILVQSFLIRRYWRYTKNTLVALSLFFLAIGALAGTCATGVMRILSPSVKEHTMDKIPALIWLTTEAVADLGIAAALLWELRDSRAICRSTRSANSLLNRLVAVTIRTGTATATLTVAALAAFLLKTDSNIPGGITYTLGRTYTLSMLANLNIRRSTSYSSSCSITSTGVSRGLRTPSEGVTFTIPTDGTGDLSGIHVHPLIRTSIDSSVATFKSSAANDISPMEIEMLFRDERSSNQHSGPFAA